jgi:hypothetical protein
MIEFLMILGAIVGIGCVILIIWCLLLLIVAIFDAFNKY